MNRLLRPTLVAALAAGGTLLTASSASAEVEIGGTAGIHVFSDTNELGVADVADAPSERNSALFGLRLGVFFGPLIGVEGEFGLIPSEARELVYDVWNITYRGHLVAQFRAADPAAKLIPFVLLGGGAMQVVDSSGEDKGAQSIVTDTDAMLYAGVGAKYRVDNGWGLRLDGRILFPPASIDGDNMPSDGFTQDFEVLLSIYKEFGRKQVEKVVEPPPPDLDPDKDGIMGETDKCPTDPEDMDTYQDDDGCPDADNDGDGVADATDKCPMEPEDKDAFEDDDGCPDPDNDQDGVLDPQDKCPAEPETKNGYQDDDGCPDEIPAKVKRFTGVIKGINFRVNSANLIATSNRTLDKAVAVLTEFTDLKLEIQGHTDDQPLKQGRNQKFADNQALSQARADAVKAYFVNKGIEEARLTSIGFGDSQPAVDPAGLKGGKLRAARAKNRRVEFKLISALQQGSAAPAPAPAPEPAPAPAPTP